MRALKQADDNTVVFSTAHGAEARRARSWLKDRIERARALPPGELRFEAVEITPVLAEIILAEHNRGNRPFKARRFQYAEIMKAGDWRFTSQGISFSRDGSLNNGQNRLDAVRIAGRSVRMTVAFGEDREVFPVIDTGASRGGSDALHIAGYKNTACLAASARLLKNVTSQMPRGNAIMTNEEVLDLVAAHPGLERMTTEGAMIGKAIRGATTAAPTVAFYLIDRHSAHARRLPHFINQLADGADLPKRSPSLVLRDAMMNRKVYSATLSGSNRAAYMCAAIIKAWNLWVRGRQASMSSLAWPADTPFPMPE